MRERNNIDAVLQVSVRANELIYEEVRREQHMCEALRELMKEEFEEENITDYFNNTSSLSGIN